MSLGVNQDFGTAARTRIEELWGSGSVESGLANLPCFPAHDYIRGGGIGQKERKRESSGMDHKIEGRNMSDESKSPPSDQPVPKPMPLGSDKGKASKKRRLRTALIVI